MAIVALLHRKLRGPLADWDMTALLLRHLDLGIRGLQWQNSGGKGSKPKAIELPGAKQAKPKTDGAEIARRLMSMGMIPAGAVPPSE
jgi:hypothetical protein